MLCFAFRGGSSRCFFLSDVWQASWLRVFPPFPSLCPSGSRGDGAWAGSVFWGISDYFNCGLFCLRGKSAASGSRNVQWNCLANTSRPWYSAGIEAKTLVYSPTREFGMRSAILILTPGKCSRWWLQGNKPKQQEHLKKAGRTVQQRWKQKVGEVFWTVSPVPRNEGESEIVQDLEGVLACWGIANRDSRWKGLNYRV